MLELLWLVPILPLLGAFVLGVAGRRLSQEAVSVIGVGSTGLSFLTTLGVAAAFFQLPASEIPFLRSYFTWFEAGSLKVEASFYLDQLSLLMILVVTGVGFLIHVYSIGYMHHEGGYYRFFAYLNLFMFFMLLLVLAGNYALLFVGWEGVGLCSYLLIGFYFLRDSASDAGKKAFIVNRIGDFGFTLALLLMFRTFGSLEYTHVFSGAAVMPAEPMAWSQIGILTAISLLLFTGATGKSAQLPLYVWLPDAMEGPTPVSALIHAATMVAAGVYMVARSHILFAHAPLALTVVAIVGCLTAFFAATIALVQTDIKRVLAYSTVSQLGYMFLGLGAGAFASGIFHLMTHAFFKALLFLGAGSVIHAMSGQQDIRKMGGLWPKIRTTAATFWMATLAIAGAPLFSGFFSKDEILWQTFASPSLPTADKLALWLLGLITATMTSFYMFRLVFLTFHGEGRYTPETAKHIHESPSTMTLPLVILAVLSVVGGWVGIPAAMGEALHIPNYIDHFLEPVFAGSNALLRTGAAPHEHSEELGLAALAVLLAAAGFVTAYAFYLRNPQLADQLAETFRGMYRVLVNKYYVDELYAALFVRPMNWISERVLWQAFDVGVIDGLLNG
ncbi:MAG TPA: NADH-quinone oxidoreductase subunit L, partial [Candidatus Acidoferrales bacterium]|nr:NADH-quinone oxidoreductase subunit L [Candidatus Acidoferrales bacterium]